MAKNLKNSILEQTSLFKKSNASFIFTEDVNNLYFKELIKLAGLDDWIEFKRIASLKLDWLQAFEFQKIYALSGSGENVQLQEENDYYHTFLNLAVSIFPDKYSNHIAEKTAEYLGNNNNEWNKIPSIRYIKTNLIDNILKNNLETTYNTLLNDGLIEQRDMLFLFFLSKYEYFRDNCIDILKSSEGKNLIDINNECSIFNLYKNSNGYGYNLNHKNLSLLMEDVISYLPEQKDNIAMTFTTFLAKNTNYGTYDVIKKLLNILIDKNIIELSDYISDDRFFVKGNKVESETNYTTLESFFKFTSHDIEKINERKHEQLKNELNKKEPVNTSEKKLKI